ncbi:SPOR domain-containing protein [Pelagivirga sediminicola]|uniref:SPOR domain-containing protein n=1 Tax=Pelagivirga sediminicola TaxID=2170575 RepID=A0A2T7G436_9RHOB|nr:SPOR domain-containing protein [Pelagivirga sediminicola]PVA09168.1 SPOR domain-containing protein [Pelagivirga sediminicola]
MGLTYAGGSAGWRRAACGGVALLMLAGCQGTEGGGLFGSKAKDEPASVTGDASSVRLVERDVEAPEVFQVTDKGLWDGRPSLGGVWVAHPDVKDPERVIIRNTTNSKFVIGALFRRERANPGPSLQVSSDAAAALGMLAGAPAELNVTALRREETPAPGAAETLAPNAVETSSLDPVADVASAAIDATEAEAQPALTPTPAPAPAPRASSLARPYLQIGIFSVEQNAENTATAMRQAGMVPKVVKQESQGKAFWRVIVGPASTASERDALLKKIKGVGFDDAYAVSD